jgi:hypothetical protein
MAMRQVNLRRWPSMVVASIALFAALGGSVYAAKKVAINGRAIRTKSLPGNRLKLHSVAANRLRAGVLRDLRIPLPLTGVDINELSLGQVPNATHAETADTAQSAIDYSAGCLPSTEAFAGACWETTPSSKATAPLAASKCAARGGTLPGALELAAFAEQPGVNLDAGDEWSGELTTFSGPNAYATVTVSASSVLDTALSTATHAYRCVIPLVS